ncbi:hypothetical protein [Streptomyces cellulosae]|uniref:hypothetical protein n=1 Tax=Streptomyces cellulosae TaxID=1968 RepID=UPI00131D3BBF|nr:hypothetical protein [Streptomyces cellulosae]
MAVVVEATLDHYRTWAELNTRHVVVVFSEAARALVAQQRPAAILQVTNGGTREATSGTGLWAAGWHGGLCAPATAAGQEPQPHGIHVAQLLVNGVIESPKTQAIIQGLPADQSIDPAEVAAAVAFLAGRSPPRPQSRAASHSCRQLARFPAVTGRTGPVNGIPELTGRGDRHHYDHGDPSLPCWGYEA